VVEKNSVFTKQILSPKFQSDVGKMMKRTDARALLKFRERIYFITSPIMARKSSRSQGNWGSAPDDDHRERAKIHCDHPISGWNQ